ncbi:MAG: hypothetical protein JXQ73_18535 [Phycisphaerae bacterium]|nr:hypothetical protein [Phycisphaerae bacterium]
MNARKHAALTASATAIAIASLGCAGPQPPIYPIRGMPDQPAGATAIDFAGDPLDQTPAQFHSDQTGPGDPASWIVVADATVPGRKRVLAQTSADAVNRRRYPICIYQPLSLQNVEVSVRFKPISGKVDQCGGVIVRYQDKDNYYVLRANTLENNVRFYKLEKGKRSMIAGIPAKIALGKWHTLSLLVYGSRFIATLDDTRFEAGDATFTGSGKIGLWTKADAVTRFDHLEIKSYDGPLARKTPSP